MAVQLGGGEGKRGRRSFDSNINVTPLVDVMLVLLIVFMITAPLLVRGEEVSLPKTSSGNIAASQDQPLSVTLDAEGRIFIQQTEIPLEELATKLVAITGEGYEDMVYLRGDESVPHGRVMQVVAEVRGAGYRRIAFVTDPRGRATR